MFVLGIDTSCDETSAAIVKDGKNVLSNVVYSQIKLHEKFQGVVPEVACRRHIEVISQVIKEAVSQADINIKDIDRIAVTNKPGLIGALLIGFSTAKAMAYAGNIPLVAINHLEAHSFSAVMSNEDLFPEYICLVVSGGHTNLYVVRSFNDFHLVGRTLDDAAGEAYDKVAKILGVGYPGGPAIDRIAHGYKGPTVSFPRSYLDNDNLNFSFSGLKTAVLYKVRPPQKQKKKKSDVNGDMDITEKTAIVSGFQEALVEVLVKKSIRACKRYNNNKLAIGGGVASNNFLRSMLKEKCGEENIDVYYPAKDLCTDNAAMIAGLGFYQEPLSREELMEASAMPNV